MNKLVTFLWGGSTCLLAVPNQNHFISVSFKEDVVPSSHSVIAHAKCLSHKSKPFRNICNKSNKEMFVNPRIFISVSQTMFSRRLVFR